MPGHTGPGRVLSIFFMKNFNRGLAQCLQHHHHRDNGRLLKPRPGAGIAVKHLTMSHSHQCYL